MLELKSSQKRLLEMLARRRRERRAEKGDAVQIHTPRKIRKGGKQ